MLSHENPHLTWPRETQNFFVTMRLSSSSVGGGGVGGFLRTQGEKPVPTMKFMPELLHVACEISLANLCCRSHKLTKPYSQKYSVFIHILFKTIILNKVKILVKFYSLEGNPQPHTDALCF